MRASALAAAELFGRAKRRPESLRAPADLAGAMNIRRALVACVVVWATTSCKGGVDDERRTSLPLFDISEQPIWVMADDGDPDRLFSDISVRRLPGGRLVIGDQGGTPLRVFDRERRLQRILAGRGRGPAELSGRFLLTLYGDTVFTFGQPPMGPPDVKAFSPARGYLWSVRPRVDTVPLVTPLDRLSTGELLVQRGMTFRVLSSAPELGKLTPDTVRYGLFSNVRDGEDGTMTWFELATRQWFFSYRWPNGPIPTAIDPYPFAGGVVVVVSQDRVWFVDKGTGETRAFDGSGESVVSVRLSLRPQPFDEPGLERCRTRALAAAGSPVDSAKVQAMFDAGLLPRTMPLVSTVSPGPDGEIWVRLFTLDEREAQRFLVLSRNGVEIGTATLPAGIEVQQIGSDFVLGVKRDDTGLESVLEYALNRPSADGASVATRQPVPKR
ncbi:MAG: hypothetical protein ACE5HT_07350 [Gemmatimonadales bacterium]